MDNKHTINDLKIMQSWSLERKIQVTQTRIIEWHKFYDSKIYVSFSGGKDSTVLLDLTRRIYPDVEAVFVDTGLEYPEIREFVKSIDNVTWLKPKMNFKDVIEKYGYPVISKETAQAIYEARSKPDGAQALKFKINNEHMKKYGPRYDLSKWTFLLESTIPISHMCCKEMKKKPFHVYEKVSNKKPIVGTMTDESLLRKSEWLKNGCNSFDCKRPMSKPMSFWTEQDVLQYLKLTGISYLNVYGKLVPKSKVVGQLAIDLFPTDLMTTGANRTGCMFCMFGSHLEKYPNRFQQMKITHPKQYDYCINNLGIGNVLNFIGVKY